MDKILETVEKHGMLSRGETVVAGVSGGADSVALLHFLSRIRSNRDIILKAVHVNHNIRGDEAKRDEAFVRSLCEKLGVELVVFSIDVPSLARQKGIGEEECGREVRYSCFESLKPDKIAVAHTASDNAETVLFNLTRGSGLRGVRGILPVRGRVIRPLIELTREEVEAYCSRYSLEYVTDSTNLSEEYTRNKLRHRVVPVLKEINPSFEKSVLRFCENAGRDENLLFELTSNLIEEASSAEGLSRDVLCRAPEALRFRAVARLLESKGVDADCRMVTLCVDALENGGVVEAAKGVFFDARGECLKLSSAAAPVEKWCTEARLGLNVTPFGSFRLTETTPSKLNKGENNNAFDALKADLSSLCFRSRAEGDRFSDPVRGVSKSVKKLFIESKIPLAERDGVPILACGKEVVWIKGFRCDARFAVTEKTKRFILIEEAEDEKND